MVQLHADGELLGDVPDLGGQVFRGNWRDERQGLVMVERCSRASVVVGLVTEGVLVAFEPSRAGELPLVKCGARTKQRATDASMDTG